jgi:transposase InsO family protein
VTTRTLSNWEMRPGGGVRPPGRPAYGPSRRRRALWAVAREHRRQGGGRVGWRKIAPKLSQEPSVRLIQESLSAIKARHGRRERERRAASRVHVEVHGREVMWSVDATHLARDAEGGAIVGRVVRDVATTSTPAIAVGAPARGAEIVAQLEAATRERGGPPLVLSDDNGGEYVGQEVARWCRERRVVQLKSVPHTPQHNAWAEHANGELKDVAAAREGLQEAHGRVSLLEKPGGERTKTTLREELVARWSARLEEAAHVLDHNRPRATRGYRTARELDEIYPRGDDLVDRDVFYEAACAAVSEAVAGLEGARARRRAERDAIFRTMECFRLITRTRGGVPIPASEVESVS